MIYINFYSSYDYSADHILYNNSLLRNLLLTKYSSYLFKIANDFTFRNTSEDIELLTCFETQNNLIVCQCDVGR